MPKKKSKVNKLAKMSDEERAKYLQQRADLEEEARRRKRELIARFIKNKLDKEEAYNKINTAKLNQVWRFVLRKIKCKQMAKDIHGMMATFNFMLERKERAVAGLRQALAAADEQHRRAFQAHAEAIGDFICIGTQRIDKLQEEYDKQKNQLLELWDKEEVNTAENQEQAELHLSLVIYIQNRDYNKYKKETDMARATALNDARLEHEEDIKDLRRPRESEVEALWTKLRKVYNDYAEYHKPIMKHYQLLKEKDEFYQRDIAKNDARIRKATEVVATLQREYTKTSTLMEGKVERMRERRDQLAHRVAQMKKTYHTSQTRGQEDLELLVEHSQGAIERLEGVLMKIEKVQQLAEICGKHEQDSDRECGARGGEGGGVTSPGDDDVTPSSMAFDALNDDMANVYKEFRKMGKFLQKMNHVKVQNMSLTTEKAKLLKENNQLKLYIKKCLTDLALKNEGRPSSSQPQATMSASGTQIKINRPVTCIEGAVCNAVLHEKRMQIEMRNQYLNRIRSYPRIQNWMKA